jgi:hypothetical protein
MDRVSSFSQEMYSRPERQTLLHGLTLAANLTLFNDFSQE